MAAFDRPEYDRYVRLAEMMISFLRVVPEGLRT